MMRITRLFSDADLESIRQATAAAESKTGGEIVPYIVERVIDHDEARWRGATFGALAAALVAGLINASGVFWGAYGVWWITLPAVMGAGFGYLLAGLDSVGRLLLSEDHLERYVDLRAEAAFLQEEVFSTRDRTGILIFLALFEHKAVILADEGIHRVVPSQEWQQLVDDLVAGIKDRRGIEALREVITRCGEILVEHELELRPDDDDELSDALRIKER